MPDDFVELEPDTVATAGRQTAATSGEWSGWASQVGALLRGAGGSASDAVVSSLIEDHLTTLNPWLHQLAADTEALGGNATSASYVVADGDGSCAVDLGRHHADAQTTATHLNRPVNYGGTGAAPGWGGQ
jgi:hypothetical protein